VASPFPHELLTAREVAALMRVSTMTVYRLIKAGELPAIRVGKHLRIRSEEVTAYLDRRVVRAAPAPGRDGPGFEGRGGGAWPAA
jgi:excisionase family DNA binding protein